MILYFEGVLRHWPRPHLLLHRLPISITSRVLGEHMVKQDIARPRALP